MLCFGLVTALLVSATACSKRQDAGGEGGGGDGRDYSGLIVGKWEGTEGELEGATMEIDKGGAITITKPDGKNLSGTYELRGASLKPTLDDPKEHWDFTIRKLDENELVMRDEDGDTHRFKRK
jgi:uncharacterized protein (TIGR03066 family)